ncbi:MAG TPA: amidohydrolase, partial [Bacillota bacterium]|nr:amidohydrolase [Bacillota bacterium]
MKDHKALKASLVDRIERNREEIIGIGDAIYRTPETGFKEFKTAGFVKQKLAEWGLTYTSLEEYPGIKVTLDTGKEGPGVAVVAELDAIICREHPDSDKETGAVHACGHNAQMAAMMGALKGILDTGILENLCGKLHFIAVPAEEYIEIAYRMDLRKKGILKYLGGKPELLRKGFFDDVDLCLSIHSTRGLEKKILISKSLNGCVVKNIKYIGKPAHAGTSPHLGINALYAANLGLSAINAIRETFREEEYIRVHPIITKGGDIVNVIPGDVRMETFVRGKTLKDMLTAGVRVDRALVGAAAAMGAKVEIEDLPGYLPAAYDERLRTLAREVGSTLVRPEEMDEDGHDTGSTDWGDISSLMPVLETSIAGITGTAHGADYKIADPDIAYVLGAKYLASMAVELLLNDGEKAKGVLKEFTPLFRSKQEYFDTVDKLFRKRCLPQSDYSDEVMEDLIRDL